MIVNEFGDCIFYEKDIIDALYNNKNINLAMLNILDNELVEKFNQSVCQVGDQTSLLTTYVAPNCRIESYDQARQTQWLIPEEYQNIDIKLWLVNQCKTPVEIERVTTELKLFEQKNMLMILVCLKYLVDFMRKENIMWGVGRGSSVASYCLFLIGVHRINSIKYSLDITEFFKGEIHE